MLDVNRLALPSWLVVPACRLGGPGGVGRFCFPLTTRRDLPALPLGKPLATAAAAAGGGGDSGGSAAAAGGGLAFQPQGGQTCSQLAV
jgi:hypothetical protein